MAENQDQGSGFILSVRGIINMAAQQLGLGASEKGLLNNYAFSFFWEYKSVYEPSIETLRLKTMPANRLVKIPLNMKKMPWIRIGYVKPNGEIREMGLNRDMAIAPVSPSPRPGSVYSEGSVGFINLTPGNGVNEAITGSESFFMPNKTNGAFTFDYANGVIRISPNVYWPNFYMDYKSSCAKPSMNTYVFLEAQRALLLWIKHHYQFDRYEGSQGNKYRLDMEDAVETMGFGAIGFTFEEFINAGDQLRGYTE